MASCLLNCAARGLVLAGNVVSFYQFNLQKDKDSEDGYTEPSKKVADLWRNFTDGKADLKNMRLKEIYTERSQAVFSTGSSLSLAGSEQVIHVFAHFKEDKWANLAMFFVKHDIALTKSNARLIYSTLSLVIGIAISIFVTWYAALAIGYLAYFVCNYYGAQCASRKAYDFAFENATVTELKELISFLTLRLGFANSGGYSKEVSDAEKSDFTEMRDRAISILKEQHKTAEATIKELTSASYHPNDVDLPRMSIPSYRVRLMHPAVQA